VTESTQPLGPSAEDWTDEQVAEFRRLLDETRRRGFTHRIYEYGRPYCGAEFLPHATLPDGSPVPIVCDRPIHLSNSMHHNEELDTWWQWQDADGNWRHPGAA
jgi:hypothetical protein